LPTGSSWLAATGLASGYLILTAAVFGLFSLIDYWKQRDDATVWFIAICIATAILIMTWKHFNNFIEQRLFTADVILIVNITLLTLFILAAAFYVINPPLISDFVRIITAIITLIFVFVFLGWRIWQTR
jgi:hypothetical protein